MTWLSAPSAHGQEEDTADHGSRAVAKASGAAKTSRRKPASPLTASYHAGAFAGTFVESTQMGLLVNAGLGAAITSGRHRERLELDYQYDPFTTKTFNFPEEDQAPALRRLAQGLHELDLGIDWQGRWSSWVRSELDVSGDAWFPDNPEDRRWSLRSDARLRVGRTRGVYAEPSAALFFKKYPGYLVAGRRIDQEGAKGALEAGYQWGPFTDVALGYELEFTDYLDARYDRLDSDAVVVRAEESKDYLSQIWSASAGLLVAPPLRLSLRYEHELNDSKHYDRRIAALDDLGNPLAKFLPDYYDYARDRATFKARFLPSEQFSMSGLIEGWLRDFSSYEARDESNVWTGDLRHDSSLEFGLEVALGLLEGEQWGLGHGLFMTAFGSHLRRRSNMRREVSLATNFDVTRAFLGLELRSR